MRHARRLDGAFKDRLSSAALALLLQTGFIAAFLYAFPVQTPPRHLEHEEEIFFLPPLPRIVPRPEAEPAPPSPAPPVAVTPPLFVPPPTNVTALPETPPAQALRNFGQALQDCAPENYANLLPQQRAHCTRPGEGVAIQQYPDPLHPPHPARDEANWQEQFRVAHLPYPDCPPSDSWVGCEAGMREAEIDREKQTASELAYQKAQALKPAERPLPQHLGAPPRASTESVGVHPQ